VSALDHELLMVLASRRRLGLEEEEEEEEEEEASEQHCRAPSGGDHGRHSNFSRHTRRFLQLYRL
jgi:hypothetical protein